MTSKKTITLTWTKVELDHVVRCLSLYLPRPPLLVSASTGLYCCPTCYSEIEKPQANYCCECGQCFDWDEVSDWAEELTEFHKEPVT